MFSINGGISSARSFDLPKDDFLSNSSSSPFDDVQQRQYQRARYQGPIVMFSQLPNSHPFSERLIVLSEGGPGVRVGRAIAKLKPCNDNAIFDCKVLSRSHAILSSNNGKVWIVDCKSSNGTWVNGQRLSRSGEESHPKELFSGDIIQFGVDVVETQTSHACIISQVTIFNTHGKEVLRERDTSLCEYSSHTQEQVCQLSHYLQEALFRERALSRKMERMQYFLVDIEETTEQMWQLLLNEDRLMSKLKTLELQLTIYSSSHSTDSLEALAVNTLQEKRLMEEKREDMYEGLLQEKLNVLERLGEVELHLINSEEECAHLRRKCEEVETSFSSIYESFTKKTEETETQQKKLESIEDAHRHMNQALRVDRKQLQKHVEEMEQQIDHLQEQLDRLEAEKNQTEAQYSQLKNRFDYAPDSELSFIESNDLEELNRSRDTSTSTASSSCFNDASNSASSTDHTHCDIDSQYATMNMEGRSDDIPQPHSSMVMSTDSAVVDSPSLEEEASLLLQALRAQIHYCQSSYHPSSLKLHDVERMHAAFRQLDDLTLQTSLSEVAEVIRQHVHYMLEMLRSVLCEQQEYHSTQQLRLSQQLYSYTQRVLDDEETIKALKEELLESQESVQEKQFENEHLRQLLQENELRRMSLERNLVTKLPDLAEEDGPSYDCRTLRNRDSRSSPFYDDTNTFPVYITNLRPHPSGSVEEANILSDGSTTSLLQYPSTSNQRCSSDMSELTPQARWILAMSVVPLMVLLLGIMASLQLWITGR